METLQVEVSWGMGPRFERQGSVRVVRETGVPLAAVSTLEPPKNCLSSSWRASARISYIVFTRRRPMSTIILQ